MYSFNSSEGVLPAHLSGPGIQSNNHESARSSSTRRQQANRSSKMKIWKSNDNWGALKQD